MEDSVSDEMLWYDIMDIDADDYHNTDCELENDDSDLMTATLMIIN